MEEFKGITKYANSIANQIQGYLNLWYKESLSNEDILSLKNRFGIRDIYFKDNLIECRGKESSIFYQIKIDNKRNKLSYTVSAKFLGIDRPKLLDY